MPEVYTYQMPRQGDSDCCIRYCGECEPDDDDNFKFLEMLEFRDPEYLSEISKCLPGIVRGHTFRLLWRYQVLHLSIEG